MPDSRNMYFFQSGTGLYYHGARDQDVSLVNNVEENNQHFTARQYEGEKQARRLYDMVSRPSQCDFKAMIHTGLLKNCPVNIEDITIAEKIFGPDVGSLKWEIVRKTPTPVITNYVPISPSIQKLYKNVTVAYDIMFVKGTPFLTSIARKMKFTTAEHIKGSSNL